MIYYVISLLSQIYVDGPILRAVQESWIYNDSKHFVDMPLRFHPIDTLRDFAELGERSREKKVLQEFIDNHFVEPGGELQECYPADWHANPGSIARIHDRGYRRWAHALHRIWRELCRQVSEEVRYHPELHSILYVPNPFIIPGGRFREFYYWDTYWIIKGLLFSEMYRTAEGVIQNLAYMVDNHGFVPNGGRVYYLLRSQPPLLIPMVYEYYIATGNMDFVAKMLPSLEREFHFWTTQRLDWVSLVPNGGRVYYLLRSQPPLLIPMVYEYYIATGNMDFVAKMLPSLEREFHFWTTQRLDWVSLVPNGGRVYYLLRSQPPLLIPMVYEYYIATGNMDFVAKMLPSLEREFHFWTTQRLDWVSLVPNGGRVYYLLRSQPPLLIPMVYEYYIATGNMDFVAKMLPSLEREFHFWTTQRLDWVSLVPNGGRVYYLLRSQPPLLIPMVYEYYIATGNMDFVAKMLPSLEREFHFWTTQRLDWVSLVPNGGRVYYLLRSQPPLLIPMVYEYYIATGNMDFVAKMLPSLEREFHFWTTQRLDWVSLVPNGGRVYYLLRSQPPLLIPMVYEYYIATGNMDFVAKMLPSLEREFHFWTTQRLDWVSLVPNGGRVYYLLRSQPPLLIPMVYDYYIATGNMDFVAKMLPSLEREFHFWTTQRSSGYKVKNVDMFRYFQYKVNMKTPRPESYREDVELTQSLGLKGLADKREVWSNIASAAETGWDFSTRWFAQDGDDAFQMRSIRTTSIVPVDLNAFMCMNARIMWSFFEIAGNYSKASFYHSEFVKMKQEMLYMHWNETDGIWYDYDLGTGRHINQFYLSNALPVFARCYEDETGPRRLHKYLLKTGVLNFTKGIPTSLNFLSSQQWDSSNSWPPLVHMVIEGFRTSGDSEMYDVARDLATKWLDISYVSYSATNAMFEKYNASAMDDASRGQGGEYEVQTGFGWTNGVVLDLMGKFASYDEVEHEELFVLPDIKGWARIVIPTVLFLFTSKYIRLHD